MSDFYYIHFAGDLKIWGDFVLFRVSLKLEAGSACTVVGSIVFSVKNT